MRELVKFEPETKFGRLTVIENLGVIGGKSRIKCGCDCGKEAVIDASSLKAGRTNSCGCLAKERKSECNIRHGMSRESVYSVWKNMIQRCTNSNRKEFKNYGGRGISVCDEWHDAAKFIEWAVSHGYQKGLELDRENNDLGYCPDNCRFITRKHNGNNKRNNVLIVVGEERHTLTEWAELTGLHYATIKNRIKRGLSGEQLIAPARW